MELIFINWVVWFFFLIILNIFIYKITFWALSMILSNKRVLEKLQKQVDDTLGNTPGNLIKSSVWCTSTVVLGSEILKKITFWICKYQKYLEIIDIIKHLFKLFFLEGWGGGLHVLFIEVALRLRVLVFSFFILFLKWIQHDKHFRRAESWCRFPFYFSN